MEMPVNIKDGLSQSERWLDTLVPDYVEIESREIPDLVRFISELSAQFHYFNTNNKPEGTWEDLFISDPFMLAILISRFDLSATITEFEKKKAAVYSAADHSSAIASLNDLFHFIYKIVLHFHELKTRGLSFQHSRPAGEFITVTDHMEQEIAELRAYFGEAMENFGGIDSLAFSVFENEYNLPDASTGRIFDNGNSVTEKIANSLSHFTHLFDAVYSKFSHLILTASHFVRKEKFQEKTYSPHLALFITFLDLFSHLKKQMNGITGRHLDYYFKEIIGMRFKPAGYDEVHLLFEHDKKFSNSKVTQDNFLIAEIPGLDRPLRYQLEKDILLSKAEIAELKTIFVSDYPQLISTSTRFENVNEIQLFRSNSAAFNPGLHEKSTEEDTSWPLFGEDQHDLSGNLRTMENVDLGILFASPLFYQTEGERCFKLTIHLKSTGSFSLKNYIDNYSKLSSQKESTVTHNLFSTAFLLDYSVDTGWENIDKYSVKADLSDESTGLIEIDFRLIAERKPFVVYDANIHGIGCSSPYPMIRVFLNNFAEHNPYSFLREVFIDRVTFNIKVKGFRDLKIQNNIGPLSPSIPFTPFGPLPSVGSFMDIKNTNVFNRYTKAFSFNIEWLNLPKEEGGFKTYYAAYGPGFSNDAFKIGLSGLQGGKFRPEPQQQQRFNLFRSKSNGSELENTTTLTDIDFKKIEFLNTPGLAAESAISEAFFREGAVRLELCSPDESFGHHLFPQLFPEIVLHNSKRFSQKRSLPNQPYTPMIKSLSVDYELEYSENFKDASDEQTNIQLFHLHPFGFEHIFPGSDKKNYHFMPQFRKPGNLYIGLKNADPSSVISMLFQIEEKNFHHTMHSKAEITWSFLESNTWTKIRPVNVLSDSTNSFINPGIVTLRLPDKIYTDNTILSGGLFWIRASIEKGTRYRPRVIAVHTNAVKATRVDDYANGGLSPLRLPKGKIKKFQKNLPGVQSVWQPFSSSGGQAGESLEKYYVRVSERLRHKQRPSQDRDIEQLILEEFPQILIAKCFNPKEERFMPHSGIDLQVVLIPKEQDLLSREPKVSLSDLFQIKNFLEPFLSPFVKIEAGNPTYEKVKIICNVMFLQSDGNDTGFLVRKLTEDINRYVAPWLYGGTTEIKIGSKIFLSEMQMFVNTLPYVNYVTSFSAVHFFKVANSLSEEIESRVIDSSINKTIYISGSTPSSVLIPSITHVISVINEPEYKQARNAGIGDLIIGEEFLVSEPWKTPAEPDKILDIRAGEEELFNIVINHNIEF